MTDFLKYSSKTQSNIILKEDFENLTQEVFNIIATNISRSLGPLGSSATIFDGTITEATKDGHAILMSYRFRNTYKRMIYNLIKVPCVRTNNTVGDGTTTSIALANAMFNRYKQQKDAIETLYRLPRHFNKIWDEIIEELCERIQKKSVTINPEDYDTIYNLAYVTSNGNDEISKEIAKAYNEAKAPNIKQKDSPTNKSYLQKVEGFEFPTNFIDEIYIRNQDCTSSEEDIAVMIFNFKIETDFFEKVLVEINKVMRAMKKRLLIIAPSYDKVLCDTRLEQYLRFELSSDIGINMIFTQFSFTDVTDVQLGDLATVLRAKVVSQDLANILLNKIGEKGVDQVIDSIINDKNFELYRLIGNAKHAMLTFKAGAIFNVEDVKDDERYKEVLSIAEHNLETIINQTDFEHQSYAAKIYEARARVMQLKMNNYIYYIGADSDLQKKIIWDSIEDVIKCLRSAIRYGVVPGCQLSIITSCMDMIKEIIGEKTPEELKNIPSYFKLKIEILNIISSAAVDVYSQVLHGPDGMGMVKLIPDWFAPSFSKFDPNDPEHEKIRLAVFETFSDEDKTLLIHGTTEQKNAINKSLRIAISNALVQQEAIKKGNQIISESIDRYKTFDLEDLNYSDNIITSAETDRMVLISASELIKILISGNQCIFIDADIDGAHEEVREVY